MRLTKSALAIPMGLVAMVVFVPRFTAPQLEAYRKEQLLRQPLPVRIDRPCLVAEERDAVLARRIVAKVLWQPVCREFPPPAGKVIIEHETRADYAQCREQLRGQSRADCFLNEPLAFLADDQPRTVARMKLAGVVWVTPQPLAWGDHLVAEHRGYLLLFLFGLMLSSVMVAAGWRARDIYASLQ